MNSDWGVDEIASRGVLANEERESISEVQIIKGSICFFDSIASLSQL